LRARLRNERAWIRLVADRHSDGYSGRSRQRTARPEQSENGEQPQHEPDERIAAAFGQFLTPERRARLLTDLARVWDLAGQPERAIGALVSACGQAASEVRDRPSIRSLARDLVRDHPADTRAQRLGGILDSGGRWQA
jgi:DNA-binding TFAR19-related protein (PDSD5 family)